ncbi:urocortin-3-like [Paramormyrops kingsleyae]
MSYIKPLFVLTVLCTSTSCHRIKLYKSEPSLLDGDISARNYQFTGADGLGSRNLPKSTFDSQESRRRRIFPTSYLKQVDQRNAPKSVQQAKFTLSLDVPTNIMNILFSIAKDKNLRAKADDNARLLAQIGKRK